MRPFPSPPGATDLDESKRPPDVHGRACAGCRVDIEAAAQELGLLPHAGQTQAAALGSIGGRPSGDLGSDLRCGRTLARHRGPRGAVPHRTPRRSPRTSCTAAVARGIGEQLLERPEERDLDRQRRSRPADAPSRSVHRCARSAVDGRRLRASATSAGLSETSSGSRRPAAMARMSRSASWRAPSTSTTCSSGATARCVSMLGAAAPSRRSSASDSIWPGPSWRSALMRRSERSLRVVVRSAAVAHPLAERRVLGEQRRQLADLLLERGLLAGDGVAAPASRSRRGAGRTSTAIADRDHRPRREPRLADLPVDLVGQLVELGDRDDPVGAALADRHVHLQQVRPALRARRRSRRPGGRSAPAVTWPPMASASPPSTGNVWPTSSRSGL